MPVGLEKIRKDIIRGNPKMSKSMSYAIATNIWKKRKGLGVSKNKGQVSKSRAYAAYEKSEPRDNEARESYSEKVREMKLGLAKLKKR